MILVVESLEAYLVDDLVGRMRITTGEVLRAAGIILSNGPERDSSNRMAAWMADQSTRGDGHGVRFASREDRPGGDKQQSSLFSWQVAAPRTTISLNVPIRSSVWRRSLGVARARVRRSRSRRVCLFCLLSPLFLLPTHCTPHPQLR